MRRDDDDVFVVGESERRDVRRRSLSGEQHVVVGAASGGDDIGETRPVATRTRYRGSHGQTIGPRARRKGLCGRLLV